MKESSIARVNEVQRVFNVPRSIFVTRFITVGPVKPGGVACHANNESPVSMSIDIPPNVQLRLT